MRGLDVTVLGAAIRRRFAPLENYAFWSQYFPGFAAPCRDLLAVDVDLSKKAALREAIGQLLTPNRNRFLAKLTGVRRIAFLHEVFPDAKFVHVIRDGRAVAHSRMKTPFWKGWQGLNLWAGAMPELYRQEWARHNHSFVALAGIEWKTHLDQFEELKRRHPEIDIYELRYEAFCAEPIGQLSKIAKHCDLKWDKSFEEGLLRRYVSSANEKWRTVLTTAQQEILEDVTASHLLRYGYEVGRVCPHERQDERILNASPDPHTVR